MCFFLRPVKSFLAHNKRDAGIFVISRQTSHLYDNSASAELLNYILHFSGMFDNYSNPQVK